MNKAIALAIAARIQQYMKDNGITQEELAKKAGVSQTTVHRSLKGEFKRNGAASTRLFIYLNINEYNLSRARDGVMTAFDRIWDYSEGHANAIARVIDAIGEICRARNKE